MSTALIVYMCVLVCADYLVSRSIVLPDSMMVKAETGGVVLFACTGVEPREGQRLVVVGSSSELGGWDASQGAPLHRVKNPAFPGVWMSFPFCHRVCSDAQFQFALVGPGASHSMTLSDGESLTGGGQNSSELASALLLVAAAAAPTEGRSEDCCEYVWEPLGSGGSREMEVVDGGLVLFGGRWGERETQVTPLTWEDIVLAQQQLEQDSLPSDSSNLEAESEEERGQSIGGGNFGGPSEGAVMAFHATTESDGASGSVSALPRVKSAASSTFAVSKRGGGKGKEKGNGMSGGVQSEAEFPVGRGRVSGQEPESGGGGKVTLREICAASVGGAAVACASQDADTLMTSAASGECDGLSRGGDIVMGERREEKKSDQQLCFAPAAVKNRWGVRGEEADLLGGKGAGSVSGLTGRYDLVCGPRLLVGESQSIFREPQADGQALRPSATCVTGGPKRRRLFSPSVHLAVSESHPDSRGGEETSVSESSLSGRPLAMAPQGQLHPEKSRLSCNGLHQAHVCQGDNVCGSPEKGQEERRLTGGEGKTENRDCRVAKRGQCEGRQCGRDSRGCTLTLREEGDEDLDRVCGEGSRSGIGGERAGRKREYGGEVKRDRHRNILCPHGRIRRVCKECGGRGICEHGRERNKCKDYGGKSICEHGRQRYKCKECGAKGICEHGRIRPQCKQCGGASICEHGRQRRIVGIVEGRISVSTVAFVVGAKIAEGRVFASTAGSEASVRSVGGRVSVSTVASVVSASSAEGRASVSTAGSAVIAGIVEGRVFVSTVASVVSARSVGGMASAFTGRTADTALIANWSLLFLLD
uniref:CBM20 domain-containing protein n=1 Tax=Chromera velia CCMP2878 TaxID=1169474 RepID=A0A0K6S8W1_9ALVE|eukprot:Cvel_1033.t2-p1 / transcript=Cvel_1033.t2 / gene=Cvel_1033 / organism=Chromera_velia_CCMP2878 / gene_product=Zinc finger protein 283, putative / transcript_product=Zinc finger protein 283, putative / location=Cvel_scaffold33:149775-152271(-) / protein_length=816 / sequence_SO=supercontig / SO=protein_coding / is_pseudo=false